MLIALEAAKNYLRVDSSDDDALIAVLSSSAETMVRDVARMTDEEWEQLCADMIADGDNPDAPMIYNSCLYALGYLYTHREDAKGADIVGTLRHLLGPIREKRSFG